MWLGAITVQHGRRVLGAGAGEAHPVRVAWRPADVVHEAGQVAGEGLDGVTLGRVSTDPRSAVLKVESVSSSVSVVIYVRISVIVSVNVSVPVSVTVTVTVHVSVNINVHVSVRASAGVSP